MATPGWVLRGAPASTPRPVTTFSTPAGSPTACAMAASSRLVTLACSLGFRTAVLPAASAGATFHCEKEREQQAQHVRVWKVRHFPDQKVKAAAMCHHFHHKALLEKQENPRIVAPTIKYKLLHQFLTRWGTEAQLATSTASRGRAAIRVLHTFSHVLDSHR